MTGGGEETGIEGIEAWLCAWLDTWLCMGEGYISWGGDTLKGLAGAGDTGGIGDMGDMGAPMPNPGSAIRFGIDITWELTSKFKAP